MTILVSKKGTFIFFLFLQPEIDLIAAGTGILAQASACASSEINRKYEIRGQSKLYFVSEPAYLEIQRAIDYSGGKDLLDVLSIG